MAAVYISIIDIKLWKPLSRTHRLDAMAAAFTQSQMDTIRQDFARWLAELLKFRVRRAIKTQQFPVQYAPLSKMWKDIKKKEKWKPGFWQASEFLYDNIKVWLDMQRGIWCIGFPKNLKHKYHDKEYLYQIAQRLELGDARTNLPPRPLFTPLGEEISKNIIQHFIEFCELHHKECLPYLTASTTDAPGLILPQ